MRSDPIVIVSAVRTPLGNFQGVLAPYTATDLGAACIKAAVAGAGVAPDHIDDVLMGCVLPAGLGQAPARQAALKAGLALATPCTTINKVCGSGMKAVMIGHDQLFSGNADIIVAGGMESMSNAPYLLPKARQGYRAGHQRVIDHMLFDSLEDAYDPGQLMGVFAEQCAAEYQFSREQQDQYAHTSLTRAQRASEEGSFAQENCTLDGISVDEGPQTARLEKISQLKPTFADNGTITAATASSIADGAAALLLMRQSHAKALKLTPLARIIATSSHAQAPKLFPTAPIQAIEKLLVKTNWRLDEVDLFEINEAFAVVVMAAMRALDLPHERVNIHGGACALGHPIGASGARIIVTLLHALNRNQLKRGIATLCIGGGEATAIAVEMH